MTEESQEITFSTLIEPLNSSDMQHWLCTVLTVSSNRSGEILQMLSKTLLLSEINKKISPCEEIDHNFFLKCLYVMLVRGPMFLLYSLFYSSYESAMVNIASSISS